MKAKFFFSFGLAALMFASYAPPAGAAQPPYVYLAEDAPKCQRHPEQGVDNFENCVDAWWWSGQSLPWNSYSQIRDEVLTVIGDNNTGWKHAIPYLYYQEVGQSAAKLLFFYIGGNPCGDVNAAGCYRVMDTLYDPERDAEYTKRAFINVNSDVVLSPSGPLTRAVIAHELGHHYGLDERYSTNFIGQFVCNDYERTIMDAFFDFGGNLLHCDGIEAPTELDKQRVNAFWRGGDPARSEELRGDLPILGNGIGPVATFRWHDLAWAEKKQYLDFQYRINDSSPWVTYISAPNYTAYIGTHTYTEDRSLGIIIDISRPEYQDPIVPNGATWHRACAWAWFDAYQLWGNGQCSWAVQLVK